jgi:hypothetical protein
MKIKNEEISTQCTWGDGPDVSLYIKRSPEQVDTWGPEFVPLDLTAQQATTLGSQLIMNGRQAMSLEKLATKHDGEEKENLR